MTTLTKTLFPKRLVGLTINEISIVDSPACPGADIILAKGAKGAPGLVHTPGKLELFRGGRQRKGYRGRTQLYAKSDAGPDIGSDDADLADAEEEFVESVADLLRNVPPAKAIKAVAKVRKDADSGDTHADGAVVTTGTALSRLEALAADLARRENLTPHSAFKRVCNSPEGRDLYAKHCAERKGGSAVAKADNIDATDSLTLLDGLAAVLRQRNPYLSGPASFAAAADLRPDLTKAVRGAPFNDGPPDPWAVELMGDLLDKAEAIQAKNTGMQLSKAFDQAVSERAGDQA